MARGSNSREGRSARSERPEKSLPDKEYYEQNRKFFREYGYTGDDAISKSAQDFAKESLNLSAPKEGKAIHLRVQDKIALANGEMMVNTKDSVKQIIDKVFNDTETYNVATAIAQMVTERAFDEFGRSDKYERNAFSIAEGKPNGISVTPNQMRSDVTALLINYAGAKALGYAGRQDNPDGEAFIKSIVQRFYNENRAYAQYGAGDKRGGIENFFDAALDAMDEWAYNETRRIVEKS
jgi:hypothetical protein